MNYTDIKDLALLYADREDAEVINRIDNFIEIVEARINRQLKVSDMSSRAIIDLTTVEGNQDSDEYFGLPADFGGLRDIEVQTTDRIRCTAKYLNPEQMNSLVTSGALGARGSQVYYSIIANQLQINPIQSIGNLEIVYYQKIIPLTVSAPNNWMSDNNPDCYVFGILVEISAFTKDKEALGVWELRYKAAVDEIDLEDSENRWSGSPLEIKVG